MDVFSDYLKGMDDPMQRERMETLLRWIGDTYPGLEGHIKWNTPMFTDRGSFIIGISTAKQHLSIAPEEDVMAAFAERIQASGYTQTKGLFRIRWKDEVDYPLIGAIIDASIESKKDETSFWKS
ncbi:iron chaperone [Salisediminibacterium selenitireducens]|uniref:YdhG-like domain-containing protein n=1 Tax=Bacillus selenitireducens (strain ATCC 700615 / DSM 15326 / MLS10) TaxID=439292 RepID=D6XYC3_BACIE|nr:DUF1801 domain-containing protein [Salisediminibacterium selenitireducens]ADI00192.1 Domain of unknown function DUF1801 [[Bacillus] selenitireducens MLS10]